MNGEGKRLVRKCSQAFVFLLAFLLVGCSTFNRDWKRAGLTEKPVEGIEGRWEGHWVSHVNGHKGALRCLVSKEPDGTYKTRFHAKYRRILRFGYTVMMDVHQTNSVTSFQGAADLGWYAGGEYQYSGRASETNYSATYQSKSDNGVFEMKRP